MKLKISKQNEFDPKEGFEIKKPCMGVLVLSIGNSGRASSLFRNSLSENTKQSNCGYVLYRMRGFGSVAFSRCGRLCVYLRKAYL